MTTKCSSATVELSLENCSAMEVMSGAETGNHVKELRSRVELRLQEVQARKCSLKRL